MSVLSVKNMHVTFPSPAGDVYAVRNVSFDVREGETLGIIGESGSGKSVIGLGILRLLPGTAAVTGQVIFDGTDLLSIPAAAMSKVRGRRISLMPQNPALALNPVLKNGLQISEVYDLLGISKIEWQSRATGMLKRLLLDDPLRVIGQYPHQLSGGMRQRLIAAISLSYNPELLIADEPTKGLDPDSRRSTIELFKGIRKDYGRVMIIITHDLDLAREICDRVAVMYSGEIVEIDTAKKVLEAPSHPYSKGLVAALPRNGLVPLEGQSPSRTILPAGCSFNDRCKFKANNCRNMAPEFAIHEGGLVRCHQFS